MPRVAVVGSGLAGFTAYQTLRRALAPGEIAVFGTDADPAAAWRLRAGAIRQREMRSESDGHCLPTSFPGLAISSVRRRRSPRPLLDSVLDRYHPTVDEFLTHVERLRERSGWDESLVLRTVERVAGRRRQLRAGRRAVHACAARSRPPRPQRSRRVAQRSACRAFVRAARLRGDGHGRRRRSRRGDGVAECARGRRRSRVGAPPRAGAATAECPAPVLLPPGARRLPPPRPARAGRASPRADGARPTRPAFTGTSRSSARLERAGSAWSNR